MIPTTCSCLKPGVPDQTRLRESDERLKLRQQKNYDNHHGARPLPELHNGRRVWVPERDTEAEVVAQTNARSYQVVTPEGECRRNRIAMRPLPARQTNNGDLQPEPAVPENGPPLQEQVHQPERDRNEPASSHKIVRRSGRHCSPPERFDPS